MIDVPLAIIFPHHSRLHPEFHPRFEVSHRASEQFLSPFRANGPPNCFIQSTPQIMKDTKVNTIFQSVFYTPAGVLSNAFRKFFKERCRTFSREFFCSFWVPHFPIFRTGPVTFIAMTVARSRSAIFPQPKLFNCFLALAFCANFRHPEILSTSNCQRNSLIILSHQNRHVFSIPSRNGVEGSQPIFSKIARLSEYLDCTPTTPCT